MIDQRNAGNWNTGECNAGDLNTGDWNTGDYNTGDYNVGDLNTNTPTVRLFNKDSGWEFFSAKHLNLRQIIRYYQKTLCEWINTCDMSAKEKEDNPTHETTQGYLKVNKTLYNGIEVTKEHREFLESVPNFCPKIFKECTGIVFDNTKTIVIDGREIEISNESYESFRKQFKRIV